MDNRHTGAEIAKAMEECLRSIGIVSKIMAITRDNASANDKFLQDFSDSLSKNGILFNSTQQSVRCFGHILNLAVQSMFKDIGSELVKLQTLIKNIRGSKILKKI